MHATQAALGAGRHKDLVAQWAGEAALDRPRMPSAARNDDFSAPLHRGASVASSQWLLWKSSSPGHWDEKSPGNFSGGRSVAENCRNQAIDGGSPRNKPVDSSLRKVVRIAPRTNACRWFPLVDQARCPGLIVRAPASGSAVSFQREPGRATQPWHGVSGRSWSRRAPRG